MAFDGITVSAMVKELNDTLAGGRINKIAQPENDELLITARGSQGQCRLLLSASASLPLLYFTDKNKPSPLIAPNFCMLLRKHIGNAKIIRITQPGLERVVIMELEHLNDLGDVCQKKLILELMGKHSNLIFTDENDMILDSIKHVASNMSSVREVLPGRPYFIPRTQEKQDPLTITEKEFSRLIGSASCPAAKAVYTSLTGISPLLASEMCFRANLSPELSAEDLNQEQMQALFTAFSGIRTQILEKAYAPQIIYREKEPVEYSVLPLMQFGSDYHAEISDSVSAMLYTYYAAKEVLTRIRQKSSDLRRIVQTALERNQKKFALQKKQMKDTAKKDKYKVYGELINTYGYGLSEGCKSFEALNYYTNETITIPLDPTLSPQQNAKKYFDR